MSDNQVQRAHDTSLGEIAARLREEKNSGNAPKPETASVRQFLTWFGNERRGYRVVGSIRRKLEEHGLRTAPDFEFQYIDDTIKIELDEEEEANDTDTTVANPTVRIESLMAAHITPEKVAPDDPIEKAITIMLARDFSQLPVMTTQRAVKGAISWRSIGMSIVQGRIPKKVSECMEKAPLIPIDITLIEAMNEIDSHDYILVERKDGTVSGIVTPTDLANEFRKHAQPFLWVGEIEHRLRNMVRGKFNVEEFCEAAKEDKEVDGPDQLTLGDFCSLLEKESPWKKLNTNLDRKEFIQLLDSVREIRNEIMHFTSDELEQGSLDQLQSLLRLLRQIQTKAS